MGIVNLTKDIQDVELLTVWRLLQEWRVLQAKSDVSTIVPTSG